jgi:DNA-binding beta-propeller fold protein YncE
LGGLGHIAIDPAGANLYIVDNSNQVLRCVSLSTGLITTVTSIAAPYGLVFDPSGNLYLASQSSRQVMVRNASTSTVTVFAGNGTNGYYGDTGAAISAMLTNPKGLAIYQNALYIADCSNHRIRRVDLSTKIITTVAGGGKSGDGQLATDAELLEPVCVGFDSSGNMFVGQWGSVIRRIDATTRIISTFAGNWGSGSFSGAMFCTLDSLCFLTLLFFS